MFGLFKKVSPEDAGTVTQALSPRVAVVVSASCCSTGMADVDERTEAACRQALAQAGLDWPVLRITISHAQSIISRVASQLDGPQQRLAQQVTQLFMTQGLSAFPVLIVDQHVVSYGGVPGPELLRESLVRLQAQHPRATDASPV
jgi:hypothetical protein